MAIGVCVTFDGNGGTVTAPQAITYLLPAVFGDMPKAYRLRYSMMGWYTSPAGSEDDPIEADIAVPNSPEGITLYARWYDDPLAFVAAGWYVFDAAFAVAVFPTPLAAAYAGWLMEAERLARLELIVAGVAADFRSATDAARDPVGGTNVSWVPASCIRHANAVVWYCLGLEMGYTSTVADYRSGWQDAEVYLRSLLVALRQNGRASAVPGTPLYGSRSDGTSGAVSSGGPAVSSGGDVSYINYGI
jgi:hypothetical protein